MATKYDEDKPKIHYLPPEVLMQVAQCFTLGAKKYGNYNYRDNMEYTRLYDAAMRHMFKWFNGHNINEDDWGLHHLDHAITNLVMLKDIINDKCGTDDRLQRSK